MAIPPPHVNPPTTDARPIRPVEPEISLPQQKIETRDTRICGRPREEIYKLASATGQWLKHSVDMEIAQRISLLLNQKYYPCNDNVDPSDPFYHSKTAAPNCFGTLLWVIGMDNRDGPRNFDIDHDGASDWKTCDDYQQSGWGMHQNLVRLIDVAGYKHSGAYKIYSGTDEKPSINFDIIHHLKKGDIILFGNINEPDGPFAHAVLYLGEIGGQKVVFEKPDSACGMQSPYRIRPFNLVLFDRTMPIKGAIPDSYIQIYRRNP